jgi:hypothetical protein
LVFINLYFDYFSVNFEHPIRLKEKFEITPIEETVSNNVASAAKVESSPELKPQKAENKLPSKGLKLSKKKQEEGEDY